MKFYLAQKGNESFAGTVQTEAWDYLVSEFDQVIEVEEVLDANLHYIREGLLKTRSSRPSRFHEWDVVLEEWKVDIVASTTALRKSMSEGWDSWRDAMLNNGYLYELHTYYTDDTFLGELQLILKGYERGYITGTSRIRTKEKAVLDLSEEQVEGVLLLVGLFRQNVYNQSWIGKDALTDPDLTYEQLLTMGPPEL